MDSSQKRISRINGQLRGIQKMVEENRSPIEILQQISAVKKAINGFTREIITGHLSKHMPPAQKKEFEDILKRAIEL